MRAVTKEYGVHKSARWQLSQARRARTGKTKVRTPASQAAVKAAWLPVWTHSSFGAAAPPTGVRSWLTAERRVPAAAGADSDAARAASLVCSGECKTSVPACSGRDRESYHGATGLAVRCARKGTAAHTFRILLRTARRRQECRLTAGDRTAKAPACAGRQQHSATGRRTAAHAAAGGRSL